MSFYITSDEHYGHTNIIQLNSRPYKDVSEMNEALVANHNRVVGENDTVIHLGDFIWKGHKFDTHVWQLNGHHIFVKGNHDHAYPSPRKTPKYEVLHNQIFELDHGDLHVVCCHYPIVEWNRYYRKSIHCYGHTHRDLGFDPNSFHVGVDTNGYSPVKLDDLQYTAREKKEIGILENQSRKPC